MRRVIIATLLLFTVICFAEYQIGEIVAAGDNASWTITGPIGHADVGTSSTIFDEVAAGNAVMLFRGQTW